MKTPGRKRIAAIDVGTNSFHLIVAEASRTTGRFHILDREKELVRLGSGASDMKMLSPEAVDRAMATLHRFAEIASSFSATVRAIATSAVREARNSDEFIRRARKETGIRIEVASGTEEARLIHLGVLQVLPLYNKKILLIDIGGGSTEFLLGRRRTIHVATSLKIGSARLTRRFFPEGRTSDQTIQRCRSFVRGSLQPVVREVSPKGFEAVVGTSGTILAVARMIRNIRDRGETRSLSGFQVDRQDLDRLMQLILPLQTVEQRTSFPGIDAQRADVLPAGLIILDETFKLLGIETMIVSEFALREGIVRDTIEKSRAARPVPGLTDIQRASVDHILEQYGSEKHHAKYVTRLALEIFDQTRDLHNCTSVERNYLEVSALLHEIGLHIAHSQHHRHSYYLIRHSEIAGYTEREKEIIANVARYHRKSHPKEKHSEFRKLMSEDKEIVRKLSAILRVADGLDRRHAGSVKGVAIRKRGEIVHLSVQPKRSPKLDIELWGANLKKDLFEEVFGVSLEINLDS